MRRPKSARSPKGPPAPRDLDQMLDRLRADALDRGERIEDARRPEATSKSTPERLTDGASTAMPRRIASRRNSAILSVLPRLQRQRRGEELDRVVRLHIGGLVGDQRVGGGVALVEAVVGELGEQLEDRVGVVLGQPLLDGAVDEAVALRVHLGVDLLAHGAAQKIGLAQRIAGKVLGDLHHLFLVDDDAVGLLQDRLEPRVDVLRLLRAVLARAIGRDVGHRARAGKSATSAMMSSKRSGCMSTSGAPHAGAFHLEHADRLAPRQHLV